MVDESGHLWVARYEPPGEERNRWDVFDPEGYLLGEVELPAGFRPTRIEEDAVLGIRRDELEVEYVELYRLEKASTGRSAGPSAAAEAKTRMMIR